MIRIAVSGVLCAVLALPLVMKVIVVVSFAVDQDYIAKNLCVNRDKPELHCNGKCILMQKLKLTDPPKKSSQPIPEVLKLEISSFLVSDLIYSPNPIIEDIKDNVKPHSFVFFDDVSLDGIFRPPKVLA